MELCHSSAGRLEGGDREKRRDEKSARDKTKRKEKGPAMPCRPMRVKGGIGRSPTGAAGKNRPFAWLLLQGSGPPSQLLPRLHVVFNVARYRGVRAASRMFGWHSYRAVLELVLPPPKPSIHPTAHPCLRGHPAGASPLACTGTGAKQPLRYI